MISLMRYYTIAFTLRMFSVNGKSRQFYRFLGNKFGKKQHASISTEAIRRGLWLIEMVEKAELHLDHHSTVLEIGTGWTHFYAIFLRLFYCPRIDLFDVWDNRQLEAFKERYSNLCEPLETIIPPLLSNHLDTIRDVTHKIVTVSSFEKLYTQLNMTYILDPDGKLDAFETNSYDMVFSGDVMEHIDRKILRDSIQNIYRILKPGGISVHQIGIDDHLTHYAPGMSTKNYLGYSENTWKLFFENNIQYFNRVQLPEFLEIFSKNNFQLLYCSTEEDPKSLININPAPQFKSFDTKTLQTVRAYIVHRK